MIYLDHASTTKPCTKARTAATVWANANGLSIPSRNAQYMIKQVEDTIRDAINGRGGRIIWCSGGTGSNSLAVNIACKGAGDLLTTSFEHKSVKQYVRRFGGTILNKSGRPDWLVLNKWLHEGVKLLSIQYVNNETGNVIFPEHLDMKKLKKQALLHIDAVQALGKIKIDVEELGCDLLTLSAHKIYGPKGIGCLWVRDGVELGFPYPGTPNTPGIIGFGIAVELVNHTLHWDSMGKLDIDFQNALKKEGIEYSRNTCGLPTTYGLMSLRFGVDGTELMMSLEDKGIYISTGAACNKGEKSYVLEAMGLTDQEISETVRISLGRDSRAEDFEKVAVAIRETVEELRDGSKLGDNKRRKHEPSKKRENPQTSVPC